MHFDLLQLSLNTVSKLKVESSDVVNKANEILSSWGLSGDALAYTRTGILVCLVIGLSMAIWWLVRKILEKTVHTFTHLTKTKWDDYLVKNKFFSACAHMVPLLLMDFFMETVFSDFKRIAQLGIRLTDFAFILVLIIVLIRFLNTARDVLSERPALKDKPLHSIFQLGKLIVSLVLGIVMVSIALNIELVVILTSMGAMTAIILLIFKDTLLGFVGSIQLSANDMVRIGDWVTVDKFGADGDVEEINLTTVKVRNFDMTITTIPTYSFISDSFRNWRGMQESDGRRISRAINIQVSTVKFCSKDLLEKLGEIEIIRAYVDLKEKEVETYNQSQKINKSVLLNGRNQTNLGIFRHYITEYLKANKDINQNMTLMVRQLDPKETGVPLQVYCFTNTKDWPEYEAVMSNIFDHLLSSVPFFELAVFENPSGADFKRLAN